MAARDEANRVRRDGHEDGGAERADGVDVLDGRPARRRERVRVADDPVGRREHDGAEEEQAREEAGPTRGAMANAVGHGVGYARRRAGVRRACYGPTWIG